MKPGTFSENNESGSLVGSGKTLQSDNESKHFGRKLYVARGSLKKNIIILFCLGILLFLFVFLKQFNYLGKDISYSRVFYDRNKTLLRLTLSADEKFRLYTDLNNIPASLIEAVLLKEDRLFFSHPGVNPIALFRASIETYIIKKKKIGGSTITMQLARLYYGINTKSIPGKLEQIFRAFMLEIGYTKNEIITTYINLVPCGKNIEGYPAAALVYFGKPLSELSISEILLLVVIPQNPNSRTPGRIDENTPLLEARKTLFETWIKKHPGDKNLEKRILLPIEIKDSLPFSTPHFIDTLLKKDLPRTICNTTIDTRIQDLIQRHAADYIRRNSSEGIQNTAIEILDYRTMEILASLGSVDYFNQDIDGQVDGTEALRSPGSTLKPFIYARAFDMGLIHPQTMMKDAPTSFGDYTPDNFLSDFKGPISAEMALITSRNIPAIELAMKISHPDLYDMLKTLPMNLKPRDHYGLSIVLGGAEVRMRDLLKLYAGLANKGILREITEIRDEPEKNKTITRLCSPEAAFFICSILSHNTMSFYETQRFSRKKDDPVAFKTGTSIGFKDCWSIGIFDNMIIAVWIGNFDGYGNPAFIGRKMAAPLMFEIIDSLRKNNLSVETSLFTAIPDKVKEIEVCQVSGGIKGEFCTKLVNTFFIPGVSPIHRCKIHRQIYINPKTGFQTTRDTPGARPEVWEFWTSDILELFKDAGLPRRKPPPFPPYSENGDALSDGFAPKIVSPLSNTEYIIRINDPEYRDIPLQAIADADVSELYWFVNSQFIGSSIPDSTLSWKPVPGNFTITVVDNKGRSDNREIVISQVK